MRISAVNPFPMSVKGGDYTCRTVSYIRETFSYYQKIMNNLFLLNLSIKLLNISQKHSAIAMQIYINGSIEAIFQACIILGSLALSQGVTRLRH